MNNNIDKTFEELLADLGGTPAPKPEMEEWLGIALEVMQRVEESRVAIRMRRLQAALTGPLANNHYHQVTDQQRDAVRFMLDAYAYDEDELNNMSYGQWLAISRYVALYLILGDIGFDGEVPADGVDDLISAVI